MDATSFWSNFQFDYTFRAEDLYADLIAIEGYKQAALNLVLPPEWHKQLDRLNRVRAVYGTTRLEGNPLSEAEVGYQLDLEDESGGQIDRLTVSKEQMQIRNAVRAQEWIKRRFVPGSAPVALSDILKIHKMVTERSDENHNVPGALRSFSVQVGSEDMGGVHIGAPHESLGELMETFLGFLNSTKLANNHPVIKALLAHFFLITVHPFGDGNGRVSRLLEAGILFQDEFNVHGFYGLSNYFYSNEAEYKSLLQQCRQNQPFDVSKFIGFGVKGFAQELAGINNYIKSKLNRVIYRQMIVQNYHVRAGPRRRVLNVREYNLLLFLLQVTEPLDPFSEEPSRKVTFDELLDNQFVYASYKDVTSRTFVRELTRLAEGGFIKFTREKVGKAIVELDFGAIARYQIA